MAVFMVTKISTLDLRDKSESRGINRVYRIIKQAGIKAIQGYKHRSNFSGGQHHPIAPNTLNRGYKVIDLFSRQVFGWTMKNTPKSNL